MGLPYRADHDHASMFFKPGISASSINAFYESPAHFWRTSPYNPNRVKKTATPAMIFGRLAHAVILTPENVAQDFAVKPEPKPGQLVTADDFKQALAGTGEPFKLSQKKDDLAALVRQRLPQAVIFDDVVAMFEATKGKRDVVSKEDWERAHAMRDAMYANKAVKQLIGNGMSESPVCWYRNVDEDAGGDLMLKTRLDYVRSNLVIEYKTAADVRPEKMSSTIANFGYHRQMAMEMEGAEVLHGERPRGAIIIAQDSDVYEAVAVYNLSAEALAQGWRENSYAIREIRKRMRTNDWRAFPEEIVPIDLPKWYGYRDAAQAAA